MYKLLILCLCFSSVKASSTLIIENGVLHTDIDNLNDCRNLDGEWKFYWHTNFENYQSGNIVSAAENLIVPGDWTIINHPKKGLGLYTLKVIAPNIANHKLGLLIPNISNNYNLYIDGILCKSVGRFDTVETNSIPEYNPDIVIFKASADTIELAFEISNYHYREGGLNYALAIGSEKAIKLQFHREMLLESFITGALLLMFFYFIAFYFIRKSNNATLYFALLCLVSSIRIVTTGQLLVRQLAFPMDWEWLFKFEFISILLIPTFGTWYLFTLLDEPKYRKIVLLFTGVSVLLCLSTLVLNAYWASHIIPPFRIFALTQLLFLLFVVTRSVFVTKHPLSRLAGLGYVFVFIFGVNDILYSKGFIPTLYLLPIGILAYVFIQAIVLTRKFANSFIEVEELSNKLKLVNKNQESIIDKRTHELENYNTIKDKIFSIIGHDLRAPIATLSSVLSLAEQSDDKTVSELRTYFKGIKRSVDNLNLTIENLLLWSQNQINGIELNPTTVSVNKEIEGVLALYNLVALQKEIVLMHKIKEPIEVWVDQAHFNLILRNIISNALKFTNIGGSIVISCSRPTPETIQLCISDNGIGIHAEKIAQLFNPQIHFTSYGTLNEKGTGLGLMLCKEYAEKNGGSIWIESSLGIGSKVCVILPSAL